MRLKAKERLIKAAIEATWSGISSGLSVTLSNADVWDTMEQHLVDPSVSKCLLSQAFRQLQFVHPAKLRACLTTGIDLTASSFSPIKLPTCLRIDSN